MKEKFGTIIGIILFVVILGGIIYLNAFADTSDKELYTEIIIVGNHFLPEKDYLIKSKLGSKGEYQELTLQEIKSRILSHPYILKAEVQSNGIGIVKINVFEKKIMAVLLTKSVPYLITENFNLLVMNPNSDITKLPVISNATLTKDDIKQKIAINSDLKRAFKIIDAAKIINEKMYMDLEEINLRHGGDIILNFSGIQFPVIFGKGSEGKKTVYLSSIWEELKSRNKIFNNTIYVDLRFSKEIFIGKPVITEPNG
ncbi:MAG: FtsQ-type POTRA domain-containing protein [Bacteroidetes bacterium]|nr:FtsQ-type POTRA domain-containing protein [Bacteroidota bacterium]MCH7769820.1 FtsQ-type POTRA domain-containing protein [Bacteroidota bacterium]